MQIGLVGSPYSGKTTLFNLLTGNNQATGFTDTGEIYIGSAVVPDTRIDFLSKLYKPKKTTYARIDFKDIPGVKMDDNKSRASQLLDEVRSSDMLVQVVRAYSSNQTDALVGSPQPYNELVDYATELILADIDALEKRIERIDDMKKINNDSLEQQKLLRKLLAALEEEIFIGTLELTASEKELLKGHNFLSEKPMLTVINIDEDQLHSGDYPQKDKICQYAEEKGIPVVEVCAKTEMEINQLEPNEQKEFLEELDLTESSLGRVARRAYELLNLNSFFTVGEDEVRAWTVNQGASARKAAGKIHSDIERGFIRAEVFHYNYLYELGSTVKVREAGQFRLEGKEYKVVDGDIISFRFNV
ncbi:MAG: redox-regulated ATPase YchF [Bacillota bacterium]